MRTACFFLALPFTAGQFHDCILFLNIKYLFPWTRPLPCFLIWADSFFKICKMIVFKIWFPSLFLNLRQSDLKKKKKKCLPPRYVYYFIDVLSTQTSLMFNMMWIPQQLEPWVHDEYTHISVRNTALTLLDLHNNRFPLQSVKVEHTKKDKGANRQQLHAQENKILEGCAVGPLRNKTTREKEKKNLMCPRCKL